MSGDDPGELAAVRRFHELIARLNSEPDLDSTLRAVVDGVVGGVGFAVAALYTRNDDGSFAAVAVAGPPDARAAVLSQHLTADALAREMARAQSWGRLRFVPHDRFTPDLTVHWMPADPGPEPGPGSAPDPGSDPPADPGAGVDPGRWRPLDALFVPLHTPGGDLTGVLWVDCPADGRRPAPFQQVLLELFAAHAEIAIDRARLTGQLHHERDHLAVSEETFRLTFDGSPMPMALLSLQPGHLGDYLRVNRALCELTGYTAEQLLTRSAPDITHPDDVAPDLAAAADALAGRRDSYRADKRYLRADGATIWVSVTTTVVGRASAHGPHAVTVVEDVTTRRAVEADLLDRATHDPLTGLLNRAAFTERLTHALHRTRRTHRPGAVLFCDLDGFKAINDTLGHHRGDGVLATVARRLTEQVRIVDAVARIGGDEFVILTEDLATADVTSLADRLIASVAEPLPETEAHTITLSVGITVLTDRTTTADAVLRDADTAMYTAKNRGRNQHATHPPGPIPGDD